MYGSRQGELDRVPFLSLSNLVSEEQPNEHFKHKPGHAIAMVKAFSDGFLGQQNLDYVTVAYLSDIISHEPSSDLSLCQSTECPLSTMLRTEHRCLRMKGKHTSLDCTHPQSGLSCCLDPPRTISWLLESILTFFTQKILELWWCSPVIPTVRR